VFRVTEVQTDPPTVASSEKLEKPPRNEYSVQQILCPLSEGQSTLLRLFGTGWFYISIECFGHSIVVGSARFDSFVGARHDQRYLYAIYILRNFVTFTCTWKYYPARLNL
jgi:hypothetical protein